MRRLLFLLALAVVAPPLFSQTKLDPDSLLRVMPTLPDTQKIRAYFEICKAYLGNDREKSFAAAEEAVRIAESLKSDVWTARSLNFLVVAATNHGEFKNALPSAQRALALAKKADYKPQILESLENCALIYVQLGHWDKAVEASHTGLNMAHEIHDTVGLLNNLNVLATAQMQLNQYAESEKRFRECLKIARRAGRLFEMARAHTSLGELYGKQRHWQACIEASEAGARLFRQFEYLNGEAIALIDLAKAQYELGDLAKSRSSYQQMLDITRQIGSRQIEGVALAGLGQIDIETDRYKEALANLLLAEKLGREINSHPLLKSVYASLEKLYFARREFDQARAYNQKHAIAADSVFSEGMLSRVTDFQVRYETAEKEAQLHQQTLQIEREKSRKNLLLGGLALAVLALLSLYQYFRNRQKIQQKEADLALALEHAEAEKLRELDQTKSAFFANISHEFRTPLTLILGPVHQWLESVKSAGQDTAAVPARGLDLVRRNANRLLDLINQLLDLSKLESGGMRLTVAQGNPLQFLRVLANAFESMAEQGNIRYEIAIPQTPVTAWFDRDKLEKITANLLSNAFKHTPPGGVVSLRADVQNNRLQIEVTDTGGGIPVEALNKIFDRFYQVEGRGEERKGTGIGLALVRELVTLHHGAVSVHSTLGSGSDFRVEMPVGRADFSQEERSEITVLQSPDAFKLSDNYARPSIPPSENIKKSTDELPLCLVVEDNLELQGYIREQLEGTFRVLLSPNGRDGLQAAIQHTPDLVISDVMMPEMDGNQLCAALKTDERTSHIPVVLLTAKAGQKSKIEGLEIGADDYLTKPFDTRELLVRAQNLVRQRETMRKQFSRTIVLQPKAIALTSADERFLQRIQENLDENLGNDQFSVEELASAVGMSRSQLHRKLTALIDQPPVEFIRNFRLRRAKEMLETGTGNVSEIGYAVGFSSPAYFSKVFRDTFGMAPSEVRSGGS
jgi:signal transduction histidine kinase/DNA-binding response OmpR family regulator